MQSIGHSIVNDPLYGQNKQEEIAEDEDEAEEEGIKLENSTETPVKISKYGKIDFCVDSQNYYYFSERDKDCPLCEKKFKILFQSSQTTDSNSDHGLWLHAFLYKSTEWKFQTKFPPWMRGIMPEKEEKEIEQLVDTILKSELDTAQLSPL